MWLIDKVERVKSQESRVSVFRLAQPVGRGERTTEKKLLFKVWTMYYYLWGNYLVKGVGVCLGALVRDLVV